MVESNKSTDGFIECSKNELDLGITLQGGQSFRWTVCEDKSEHFRGVFANRVWTLWQDANKIHYTVHGSLQLNDNFTKILKDYFRLDICLKSYIQEWCNVDPHFQSSYDKIGAVRILNQEIVENLFSFICSSNNNITRISGMVEKLCKKFGPKLCTVNGKDYFGFPTIESLSNTKVELILKKEGFGYRAGYIHKSALKLVELGGIDWLLQLHKNSGSSYQNAREKLTELPGIGPKVAECICLMSLGHLEAIPVDTHIFQIARQYYLPHLKEQKSVTPKIHEEVNLHFRQLWGPLAGWAQTFAFCVKISSTDKKRKQKSTSTEVESKKSKDKT